MASAILSRGPWGIYRVSEELVGSFRGRAGRRGSSGGTEAEGVAGCLAAGTCWRLFRRSSLVRGDEVEAARAGTLAVGGEVGIECCW